ncbi:hypothetical protein MRX96_016741 [Rhipicephalus microplus]
MLLKTQLIVFAANMANHLSEVLYLFPDILDHIILFTSMHRGGDSIWWGGIAEVTTADATVSVGCDEEHFSDALLMFASESSHSVWETLLA